MTHHTTFTGRIAVCLLACGLSCLSLASAAAQNQRGQNQRGQNQRGAPQKPAQAPTLRTTAKIKGIRGNIMLVENDEKKQWMVAMPTEARNITLAGKAVPGWLKSGMGVRFEGEFTARGQAKEPIKLLNVFTILPASRDRRQKQPQVQFQPASVLL